MLLNKLFFAGSFVFTNFFYFQKLKVGNLQNLQNVTKSEDVGEQLEPAVPAV